jgi:hypothetical protein
VRGVDAMLWAAPLMIRSPLMIFAHAGAVEEMPSSPDTAYTAVCCLAPRPSLGRAISLPHIPTRFLLFFSFLSVPLICANRSLLLFNPSFGGLTLVAFPSRALPFFFFQRKAQLETARRERGLRAKTTSSSSGSGNRKIESG